MLLIFNSLLLIAGLVTTVAGLATLRDDPFSSLIVMLGGGMMGVAWYLDRLRVRHRDESVAKEIANRIAALTGRPWQPHERLEVPPNRWLFGLMLGMTLVGGWMVQLGVSSPTIKWPLVLGGALFLAIDALLLPSMFAGIGKPALVLDRKGLTTPVDGAISWSAVEGIYLQVIENRGVRNYSLVFRVPEYAKAVRSIHWSQHWLALFGLGALRRGQVGVPLRPGKERPETIEAVARHLWKSATGREHFWSPHFSAEANQSFRNLASLRKGMEVPGEIDRVLQENPDQAVAKMEQMSRDLSVINREWKKKTRTINTVIGVAVAGMLAALLWPWVKRILGA